MHWIKMEVKSKGETRDVDTKEGNDVGKCDGKVKKEGNDGGVSEREKCQ